MLFAAVALGILGVIFLLTRNIEIRFEVTLDSAYGASLKLRVGFVFGIIPLRFSGIVSKDAHNKWEFVLRRGTKPLQTLGLEELFNKFVAPKKKKETNKKKKRIDMKIVHLQADVAIGLSDAAQCALACGGAKMVLDTVFAALAQEQTKIVVAAVPIYNQSKIRMVLSGILQVKSEQIIVNAVKLQAKKQKDGD